MMEQARNVIATAFFCLLSTIFYVECFVVAPNFLEYRSSSYYCALCLGFFASTNVLYNLICMVYTDPSLDKLMLIQRSGRDWSYCLRCETVRPPRAHHCSQCDVCVLRFDHHCTYLAQCVGHANMVYFIRLLFYLAFSCCLASIFNVPYALHLIYDGWSPWQWLLCMLNPVPFILMGWISASQFLFCLLTSFCVILGPTMFILFLHHLRQILRNQTSVEVLISKVQIPTQIRYEEHDLRPLSYDRGWRANLEQVMEPFLGRCGHQHSLRYRLGEFLQRIDPNHHLFSQQEQALLGEIYRSDQTIEEDDNYVFCDLPPARVGCIVVHFRH